MKRRDVFRFLAGGAVLVAAAPAMIPTSESAAKALAIKPMQMREAYACIFTVTVDDSNNVTVAGPFPAQEGSND